MADINVLRQRLVDAGVFMRYDYAWRHSEFGSKVDRLTGVCLRFLYLSGSWQMNGTNQIRVGVQSMTPSPSLNEAVEKACTLMDFQYVGENVDDNEPVHVHFCFIGPSHMGQVEALMENISLTPSGLYFFLVGDAACLPPPQNSEEERIRGLSSFGIGRELQGIMETRQFHAAAHYVCEFKQTVNTDTLGQVMDQFNVPQTNLMIHTEKWQIYVHVTNDKVGDVSIGEDEYWQQLSKGKVCENCRQEREKLMRCVRCQNAYYCTRECQKEAWKLHKGECQANV